ncbi:hypothetical protein MAR_008477 [Mya arenaria]|uniref:Uncharacterized protein n=1 Tax=Mya arenaria TaxID=6604 RepID=A0ABY7DYD3_MYAAR|nr:hypothetical protein MAR_008477 [Mya arenaria]
MYFVRILFLVFTVLDVSYAIHKRSIRGNVTPAAADMLEMRYDQPLELEAQLWAEECKLDHDGNYQRFMPGSLARPYKKATSGGSCDDCAGHCNGTSRLCACGGKVCLNDGVLNLATCGCQCIQDVDHYDSDKCDHAGANYTEGSVALPTVGSSSTMLLIDSYLMFTMLLIMSGVY